MNPNRGIEGTMYPSISNAIAQVLPPSARKALMEAAMLDMRKHIGESSLRTRALDAVIARIKLAYPQFFRKD